MENFKKGDVVSHKTKKELKMTIIDNCNYEKPNSKQIGQKDPSLFRCRYYNEKTDIWDVVCFYYEELLLITE
jgi:hypothetical protein